MTDQAPSDNHSETYKALREEYYHLLQRLYARLLDSDEEAGDRHPEEIDQMIEAETEDSEQGRQIAAALKADLGHIAEDLRGQGQDAREDIRREWHHLEHDWVDKLLAIADRTTVQLNAIREQAGQSEPKQWHAGEIASPKRLKCRSCGEITTHPEFGPIKHCPNCGGERFHKA